MRGALVAVVAVATRAYAQPAPYPPPPPLPQELSITITEEQRELLDRGEISLGAHLGGGLAELAIGFGLGQAIQGRWNKKGWIFTLGEGATVALMAIGTQQGFDSGGDVPLLFIGAFVGFAVFRIWGTVDAFAEPPKHNAELRWLKAQLGMPVVMPYISKTHEAGTAGVVFRF